MYKKPSHIALLLRNLNTGGCERVMLNLALGFIKQGLKVDFVLTKAEGAFLSQLPPGTRLVDLKGAQLDRRKTFKFPTSFQSMSSIPKLVRYLNQEQPTVLLAAMHYSNEIAAIAKHLSGGSTRVIVSEHNTLSVDGPRLDRLYSRLTPLGAKLFYPWADEVVAVSQGVARDLAQVTGLPEERIRVIYNPVVTPETLEKSQHPLEHPWFKPGEPPVILGVGRLVKQKDFPTLLQAFAKVRRVRSARLMILGGGAEQSHLMALARELGLQEEIALPGFVDNPYNYMAKSAVFVLSSAWEGLPTVLIEAMALGVPVVSTDCPSGPKEILTGGKHGFLVPVGDRDAIAASILQVLAGNFPKADPAWIEQFTLETATRNYLKVMDAMEKKN